MSAPGIVVILWVLFYSYWMIAAVGVKRNIRTEGRTERWSVRLLLLGLIFLVLRMPAVRHAIQQFQSAHFGPATEAIGFLLCLCGFAFAIWARFHLGRNWGQPMTLKQGHELITTGPYRFVRHPMYSGAIVMYLATPLMWGSGAALIISVAISALFVWRTGMEDRTLQAELPGYHEFAAQTTCRLVPGLW